MESPYLKGYLGSGITIPRYLAKELKGTRQADHIAVYSAQLRYQCQELLLAGKVSAAQSPERRNRLLPR